MGFLDDLDYLVGVVGDLEQGQLLGADLALGQQGQALATVGNRHHALAVAGHCVAGIVGVAEAGQEALQEGIEMSAAGKPLNTDEAKSRFLNAAVGGFIPGVGIGGVLEPLQASPVIVEDGCFIGSRCIVVEGVHLEKEVVLGANVVLTKSTKIIDVSGAEPIEYKGRVPARSVVIPGSYKKTFPAGEYQVSCALIIGQRKPSTDLKTSLNDALRDFNVAV